MSWLDRQSFLGSESDEVLAGLTVGIVGLGGGGSHIAQQLAHVGVGGFVLVDPDVIDSTNLNRLVGGTRGDVLAGTSKVAIAERLIRAVNPDALIAPRQARWQESAELLKTCDVVIAGVDSVRAKDELDAFTRRFLIPYIDMGMDVHSLPEGTHLIAGQVVLTGPEEPCLRCLGIVTEETLRSEAARYGAAGGRPQVVWPNGVLASIAVGIFIQLVLPWGTKAATAEYIEFDGNSNIARQSPRLNRVAKCSHYTASDVGDPLFDFRSMPRPSVDTDPRVPAKVSRIAAISNWLKIQLGIPVKRWLSKPLKNTNLS